MKVISLAIGELFVCPLLGSILTPKGGQTNNFPDGQTDNFIWFYVFPSFRLIVVLFENRKRKLIESQVGTPVAKLITFSNMGVTFYNIRCFVFVISLFGVKLSCFM